jgi:carbamoyl-phosphate synthase small subunit
LAFRWSGFAASGGCWLGAVHGTIGKFCAAETGCGVLIAFGFFGSAASIQVIRPTDRSFTVPQFLPALLALADGTVFRGKGIGAVGSSVGEVVFNTSMSGYQEILTDPSYCRQIVTLTYPHIGNTGINREDCEAGRVHAAGLVIRDLPLVASNWRSEQSLDAYLAAENVVAIADIDTRKLTRILREKGAQAGCLTTGEDLDESAAIAKARAFPGLAGMDLAKVVSVEHAYPWSEGEWQLGKGYTTPDTSRFHVVAYDFGVKRNILRMIANRGCRLTVVPARTPAAEVLALQPNGIFLSNGPGDPEPCDYAISAIGEFLQRGIPTFGICLGHQLLALASGAKTVKMKFGHHGANHPVKDLDSGQVLITSQNHGFAVDADSLPANLRVSHVSLFDGSLQGLARTDAPAFSFQGHPEASPGPHDVSYLFDRFIGMMEKN